MKKKSGSQPVKKITTAHLTRGTLACVHGVPFVPTSLCICTITYNCSTREKYTPNNHPLERKKGIKHRQEANIKQQQQTRRCLSIPSHTTEHNARHDEIYAAHLCSATDEQNEEHQMKKKHDKYRSSLNILYVYTSISPATNDHNNVNRRHHY